MKFTLSASGRKGQPDEEASFDLDFKNDEEFLDWADLDSGYGEFMLYMETGPDACCGVHDFLAPIGEVGFDSYEIMDLPLAVKKWKEFFDKKGKLIK